MAEVDRLRKRDSHEFAIVRRQAARWAADNFDNLIDPDPAIPQALNDRAADNWRPLLAIADMAGGEWPQRAREAACVLSGEGHDLAENVNCWPTFGRLWRRRAHAVGRPDSGTGPGPGTTVG